MTPRRHAFDLIVIGSGPAGQRAAIQGAKAGKKVAVLERMPCLGGGCVFTGTLPSKSFRESIYRYSLGSRGSLGEASEHHLKASERRQLEVPDMKRLLRRRDRVVSSEAQIIGEQFERNHVKTFSGSAKILSASAVELLQPNGSREVFETKFIIIAVGSSPVAPAHIKVDGRAVFDSDHLLKLKEIPRSLVVLGGGIIGCEYASMFSVAGTKVTLVDKRHEILASVDREIVEQLMGHFRQQKVEILLSTEAEKVETQDGGGAKLIFSNGRKLHADAVLVALGRRGNTDGLGLESVGLRPDARGLIAVDEHFRTQAKGIYAVGDVVGSPALASTSMEQGRIACCHAFQLDESAGHHGYKMPRFFPYGIYTIPEISTLGKTEEELTAEKASFVVGRARYRELARGQIVGDHWGLLKLLVDRQSLKLVGVHIIGDNAADLIHIGQAVMSHDGDVAYFIRSVFNYPTLAEAYKTAAFHALNQIKGVTTTK